MPQVPGAQISIAQSQKMISSPQVPPAQQLQQQQQQLQQQQQQQLQQQQIQQHSHLPDNSSIKKLKALVPHLKKSLSNLMRLAGEALRRDDIYASSSSASAASTSSVEKALEEFFSICDQLEMHLGIALEGFNQVIQHKKYLNPEYLKFSFAPGQSPDVVQQYSAFCTVIRSQVALASSLHDALVNCADQILAVPSNATGANSVSSSLSSAAQIGQPQPGTHFSPGGIAANANAATASAATSASS